MGERYILIRLFRRNDLPHLFGSQEFTVRTLRFAWHLTSVAWVGFAWLLALLARDMVTPDNVAIAIAVTFLVSGVITLIASRGRHLAWPVFLAVGIIALVSTA